MKKEKKTHKGRSNGQQNSTPAAHGSSAVHTTHQSPVNRTRSKLPTKRKQNRQEANGTQSLIDEYEIVVEMPRNQYRSADRGGYRGRGGLGHASRGYNGRVNHGFTMKEEAINTSDNYQTRAWMADKRSTLRHQAVVFVQSGELSNKMPTPSASESENESSHSNTVPPVRDDSVTVVHRSSTTTAVITDESGSHGSTARLETLSNEELFVIDDNRPPVSDISQLPVSDRTSHRLSNSTPVLDESPKLAISSPTIPLPPVEFIPTEENIVFTPRNQRRQQTQPIVVLTNWEVPTTFKAMTDTSAPDWTRPKKKQNRQKGHKQYRHLAEEEDEKFIEPVGLELAQTADDALQDYLENIRQQEELSDGEESYIDRMLAVEDGSAMEELSLEEKPVKSPKSRGGRRGSSRKLPRSPLSKFVKAAKTQTPERSEPVSKNTADSAEDVVSKEQNSAVQHDEKPTEEDNWYMEAPISDEEEESSEDSSDAFNDQGDLLDVRDDPVWNTESDDITSKTKGKQKAVNSNEEDEDEGLEDEDDDDDDLDDDNEIIRDMILDDFDLNDLDLSTFVTPNFTKKSRSRQPNVPPLPIADDDITSHLQSLWKKDRESKKQRKLEREKARLIGLLGSKATTKSKGKKEKRAARRQEEERIDALEGNGFVVDMRKINEEMRAFWEDDDATDYALPPMHRLARKIVHTLAHAYNLSSQSHGSGQSRYTTLFKTSSTESTPLNEHKISAILKRTAWIGPTEGSLRGGKSYTRGDGETPSRGIKKHRDGDIVGGDAKEISSDNRGRVMLEKLGWRSGMGLGAEGEGMKLPVFAVVKASKSGLQ